MINLLLYINSGLNIFLKIKEFVLPYNYEYYIKQKKEILNKVYKLKYVVNPFLFPFLNF